MMHLGVLIKLRHVLQNSFTGLSPGLSGSLALAGSTEAVHIQTGLCLWGPLGLLVNVDLVRACETSLREEQQCKTGFTDSRIHIKQSNSRPLFCLWSRSTTQIRGRLASGSEKVYKKNPIYRAGASVQPRFVTRQQSTTTMVRHSSHRTRFRACWSAAPLAQSSSPAASQASHTPHLS